MGNWSNHKKRANRTSHRYNRLPLLPSGPGGIQQELVVPACRGAKIEDYWNLKGYFFPAAKISFPNV